MSHQPERSQKNCLNCGTLVAGRYCQQCGQENVTTHMHFFPLVRHFIYDIFHFDGKFFETLKHLLFKPGFVPRQYVEGKRLSYLDPIKMYLFTSAFSFLIFFAFAKKDFKVSNELSKAERFDEAARYFAQSTKAPDTGRIQPLRVLLDTNYAVLADVQQDAKNPIDSVYPVQWQAGGKLFAARKAAELGSFEITSKSGWLEQNLKTRWKHYQQQFGGNTNAILTDFLDKLLHRFPYLLFFSLPFFAAILKLLYVRKKHLFYFDHAVFTLYHYVFSFILLLLILGASALHDKTGLGIFSFTTTMLIICWPVHLIFALKRFYLQGWGRTIVKFMLLNGIGFLVLLLLFLGFLSYSIFII